MSEFDSGMWLMFVSGASVGFCFHALVQAFIDAKHRRNDPKTDHDTDPTLN